MKKVIWNFLNCTIVLIHDLYYSNRIRTCIENKMSRFRRDFSPRISAIYVNHSNFDVNHSKFADAESPRFSAKKFGENVTQWRTCSWRKELRTKTCSHKFNISFHPYRYHEWQMNWCSRNDKLLRSKEATDGNYDLKQQKKAYNRNGFISITKETFMILEETFHENYGQSPQESFHLPLWIWLMHAY